MNYPETIAYLFTQLPMYTRVGAVAFKKDLTNTIALCNVLNNPQQHFKSVHIAGTNGKGSTSHMLASILQAAGYKVGLYTSPHLKDFRERIRMNGQMISEEYVVNFVKKHQLDFEQIEPSFFEWTVALCFDYFANQQVDIAIIETGLGGRLDSTNIITPLLSIITNIGWDHMDMLGNTLAAIATEKAGIIKPQIPVIVGEHTIETAEVFTTKAINNNSELTFAPHTILLTNFTTNNEVSKSTVSTKNGVWLSDLECDLAGNYQQHNIPTVLAAILSLHKNGFVCDEAAIRNGLKNIKHNTGLMGRWQIIAHNPLTICDTGHNVNGIEFVVHQLAQLSYNKLHIILGMVKDKDISKILTLLPTNATYYFCNANIPRALPAIELHQQANKIGLIGHYYATVKEALVAAQQEALPQDVIFIGGSTFIVAEVV